MCFHSKNRNDHFGCFMFDLHTFSFSYNFLQLEGISVDSHSYYSALDGDRLHALVLSACQLEFERRLGGDQLRRLPTQLIVQVACLQPSSRVHEKAGAKVRALCTAQHGPHVGEKRAAVQSQVIHPF